MHTDPNAQAQAQVQSQTLTPAQHAILAHAINHSAGQIDWFPDHIKGGARQKVLKGLSSRGLVCTDHADGAGWLVTPEGYEALGLQRPAGCEAVPSDPVQARTRAHSKQAEVLQMLQRPEGATIAQICGATAWQAHTVRGALAGTFKKRMGLTIISEKVPGQDRVYRTV